MASNRISVRISVRVDRSLRRRVQEEASRRGKRESDLVREALEEHLLRNGQETCYSLAGKLGLIGCAKAIPPDLSANRRHFQGFGRE